MAVETALAIPEERELSIFPSAATSLDEARRYYQELREFARSLLVDTKDGSGDYGIVPYSGAKKPSLFKSGAEKLAQLYGYAPDFDLVGEQAIFDDPHYERAPGRPFFAFTYKCSLRSKRTGALVASSIGECNTNEERFRKRDGSWMDPWTHRNPAAKMAQKRALVGATLIGCAASSLFSQDLEDITDARTVDQQTGEIRQSQPRAMAAPRPQPAAAPTPPPAGVPDRPLTPEEAAKLSRAIIQFATDQGYAEADALDWIERRVLGAGKDGLAELTREEGKALHAAAKLADFGPEPPVPTPDDDGEEEI